MSRHMEMSAVSRRHPLEWTFDLANDEMEIVEHGDLSPELETITARHDGLDLHIVARGSPSQFPALGPQTQPGAPYEMRPVHAQYGSQPASVVFREVLPRKPRFGDTVGDESCLEQEARVQAIDITFSDAPASLHMEWLANVYFDGRWPNDTWELPFIETTPWFPSGTEAAEIGFDGDTSGSRRIPRLYLQHACLSISALNDQGVRLGILDSNGAPDSLKPGFLAYSSRSGEIPVEEIRLIVREALGFVLGNPLATLGYTEFDEHGNVVRASLRQGYLPNGRLSLARPPYPAVPLRVSDENLTLDVATVSSIVGGIVQSDGYSWRQLFWKYWHAREATLDTQVALYGALLESLRDAYLRVNKCDLEGRIPTQAFKEIRQALAESLQAAAQRLPPGVVDDAALKAIENGLRLLNNRSGRERLDRFFEHMEIELGNVERTALKERNRQAHGALDGYGEYLRIVVKGYALHTTVNRAILRMVGSDRDSTHYVDYFSLGYPQRPIRCAIPEDGRSSSS